MRFRTLLLAILVLGIALFAALNWATFNAPTALSLGVASVQAPLGLIMLVLLALVAALFLAWVIWLQGSVLLETRPHARELQAQRDLADKAEASLFTELRQFIESEFARHRGVIEQTGNSLSAFIGELEDRLEHGRLPPDVPRGGGRPL